MYKKITLLMLLSHRLLYATQIGSQQYPFTLEPLPYSFSALEPHIDKATMKVHHDGHHAAYVEKLNAALEKRPEYHKYTPSQLLTMLNKLPQDLRPEVAHNAGGHLNHSLFWNYMTSKTGLKPSKTLAKVLTTAFGSFEGFKEQFNAAAKKVFGSGWAWLCYDRQSKKLVITTTANQDNPVSSGLEPILGLDVWEHAYYLKHQNKRVDYIQAFWNVINWPFIEEQYQKALAVR